MASPILASLAAAVGRPVADGGADADAEAPPGHTARAVQRRLYWAVLAAVTLTCALYLWAYLDRGWYPHDEGTLGQAAERVLAGELPHRDFDDVYTGGLAFLNALAFKVLGTSVFTMRLVLWCFFVASIPALYYIATRLLRPIAAGGVALLAAAWSVPIFPTPIPSWYNLIFTIVGGAALLRYLETNRARWLVCAGVAGGLSCLAKITGLLYIAAALLFLVFHEQGEGLARRRVPARRARLYPACVSAGVVMFVLLVGAVVFRAWNVYTAGEDGLTRATLGATALFHFVFPSLAVAALLLYREWARRPLGTDAVRVRSLAGMLVPFFIGVAAPIAMFLLPYAVSGSLDDVIRGVLILPGRRYSFASRWPVGLGAVRYSLPVLALLVSAPYWRGHRARAAAGVVAAACVVTLATAGRPPVYQAVWFSVSTLLPLVVAAGVAVLSQWPSQGEAERTRSGAMMLLFAIVALQSLIQLPFAAPVYFCYVAPLLALAAAALAARSAASSPIPAILVGFYLLFAVRWLEPGFIYQLGIRYMPNDHTERLSIPRGGVRVRREHEAEYGRLMAMIRERAGGAYIYATPDCPEVYFLSGLRNPTRTLFDFLDEPERRTERILAALERHRVRVVVLNQRPEFSGDVPGDLATALAARFPEAATVGRFEVRSRR